MGTRKSRNARAPRIGETRLRECRRRSGRKIFVEKLGPAGRMALQWGRPAGVLVYALKRKVNCFFSRRKSGTALAVLFFELYFSWQ